MGAADRPRRWVLPLAADDEAALNDRAGQLAARLAAWPADLATVEQDVLASVGTGPHRCVLTGVDATQLRDRLTAVAAGRDAPGTERTVLAGPPPRLGFVYPGLGVGYPGMGSALMAVPAYPATVAECDRAVRELAGWSVTAELTADAEQSRIGEIMVAPPATVTVQLGLTAVLESWGVRPDVVLGHSLGEITAAGVAGALSLAETFRVTCHEAAVVARSGRGGMLAVGLGPGETERIVRSYPSLSVAAHNGPSSTVVAGDPDELAALAAVLADRRVFLSDLGLEHAFHTPAFGQHTAEIGAGLAGLRPRSTRVPLVSTVTGSRLAGPELDSGHWSRLLHLPVRFTEAVGEAARLATVFVEVSPGPALTTALAQCLADQPGTRVVPGLRAGRDDIDSLRRMAAALHLAGVPVRWSEVPPAGAADAVDAGTATTVDAPQVRTGWTLHEVRRRVTRLVADELDGPPEAVPADTGLFALGLDSAGAVTLAEQLRREFALPVPLTIAFDQPSVSAITGWLAERLGVDRSGKPSRRPADPTGTPPGTAPSAVRDEPIAIVGVGLRVPGADDVEQLWELLISGTDATSELPTDRWDPILHGGDPETAGTIYSLRGGFLTRPDTFDAAFFGISPAEAERMDPQQRLLLEVAWHALEDAGLPPDRLRDSRCGVYVGLSTDDYKGLQQADPVQVDGYTSTGNLFCVAAGRLSYTLGLRGPSLAVDTGCSSSLVTVHLAAQALRAGECDVALAGGVHLMITPEATLSLCRAGALSPGGRCRTFDAAADGYARGEGCGVVVLKRISDAVRAGDRIVAVVRGSDVNHDGASSGLTVPSGTAQRALLRAALYRAGVHPADVGYVEAHGSGTPLGDPIELRAAGAVFGAGRDPARPLLVGSVKTNLGHLEAAAGVIGLVKAALVVQRGWIPPHLHLREPSPRIPWRELPVEVPVTGRPWPGDGPASQRIAGVSSFGIGGTNAHVVLSGPPLPADVPVGETTAPGTATAVVLPLSTRDPAALRQLAGRYADLLRARPDLPLSEFAAAAANHRTHLSHRLALVAERPDRMIDQLTAAAAAATSVDGGSPPVAPPAVAFVFCGQGSQYPGMGAGLAASEPVFAAALDECDEYARPLLGGSLRRVMCDADSELIHQTRWAHVALFALQYGLVALWRSWGVEPGAVLGHSMGEITAACAAGVLSVADAVRLAAARGRLMDGLPGGGLMLAVLAGAETIAELLCRHPQVSVAAVNSRTDVVLSGPAAAVEAIDQELLRRDVRTRLLPVPFAGHSLLVEPVLDELTEVAATMTHQPARLEVISTVTGGPIAADTMDAGYWRRNARASVRFSTAAQALLARGYDLVVEMGPEPVLGKAVLRDGLLPPRGRWLASLRRGNDERTTLLTAAAEAYVAGLPLDWSALAGRARRHVPLPAYPFQRRRYWRDTTGAARRRFGHPLLGNRLSSPAITGTVFETVLDAPLPAHLVDHGVYDETVVAAAHQLALVTAAAEHVLGAACRLDRVVFAEPLVVGRGAVTVQVLLDGVDGPFRVVSRCGTDENWTTHVTGTLCRAPRPEDSPEVSTEVPAAAPEGPDRTDPVRDDATAAVRVLHDRMATLGYRLGPSFHWLDGISAVPGEAVAILTRPRSAASVDAPHPGLIDSCLRLMLAAAEDFVTDADRDGLPVPVGVDRFDWFGGDLDGAGPLRCRLRLRPADCSAELLVADLTLHTADGTPLARAEGVRVRKVPRAVFLRRTDSEPLRYEVTWRAVTEPGTTDAPPGESTPLGSATGTWLVCVGAPTDPVAERLAALLRRAGGDCRLLPVETSEAPLSDRLRAEAGATDQVRGMVLLCAGGGSSRDDEPTTADLVAAQQHGLFPAAALVRLAGALSVRTLLLVTRGVSAAPGTDRPCPVDAPVHGLARVARLEHPDPGCAVLDLPVGDTDPDERAGAILRVLLGPAGEPELAVRNRRWYAPRLVPAAGQAGTGAASPGEQPEPVVRPDGAYLVSGGAGGLGRQVAGWLARRGAGRIYLLGRHQPEPAVLAALADQCGRTEIRWLTCDVTDAGAVDRVVAGLTADGPPLRGVVHAAGVLVDGVLARSTDQLLSRPLLPKLAGAWNLHLATLDTDLDFFLLFSSLAGLVGNAGQGGYAAGNTFLDALAAYRRSLGRPGVSVAWGPWAGDGMAVRLATGDRDRLLTSGLASLSPDEALAALTEALPGPAVTAVARADWRRLAGRTSTAGNGLLAELADGAVVPAAPGTDRHHPRPPGLGAPAAARTDRERTLLGIWEDVFRIRPLGVTDNFFQLGGDSILALRLLAAARAAGLRLSDAEVFTHPTVAQLASMVGPAGPGPLGEPPATDGAGRSDGAGAPSGQPADRPELDETDLVLLATQLGIDSPAVDATPTIRRGAP
ncbi:SDR family NAD(P)-dependent oxidoreductase [Micromonospora sp. NPDC003197]